MRRFYHFHREKRSVRSPNPLRAPAQSTAFSNRRFNRRAAQNRSSSDSTQTHLQNHAASASQLSTYKASCAGFTTLLRFSIKPCAALNSHASARTYFKNHRRIKPLFLRFRATPSAKPRCQCLPAIHVQSILRRIHHAPSLQHQTLRRAQLSRIRANVFQKTSPHKTALPPIPRKPSDALPSRTPSARFAAFLCFASNPAKPIQRPTIRTCSAARAGDYGQPERRRTKKPPHPIGCGG